MFKPDTAVVATDDLLPELASDGQTRLPVGRHVFQLVVVDDAGHESTPSRVRIIVADQDRPTSVIDLLDANGHVNPEPTMVVPYGTRFSLSGGHPAAASGRAGSWRWTRLTA